MTNKYTLICLIAIFMTSFISCGGGNTNTNYTNDESYTDEETIDNKVILNNEDSQEISEYYNVISQMNYCITSLTQIINNHSIDVLNRELNQLINNLTLEQIIGLDEINNFRGDLMNAIGKLKLTEEERNVTKRIKSIKRDTKKWDALSNALSPTMFLSGDGNIGPEIAFNLLLTSTRSFVEYKGAQSAQDEEELEAMWNLRKEDMKDINELRVSALNCVFSLYNKYKLKENERLTEETASLFNQYITESDTLKKIRLLLDHSEQYSHIPSYHYHLGMAYVDIGKYDSAKPCFLKYEELYNRAPIFRYDEMSGCIALVRLSYEKDLSQNDIENLITIAKNNLPSNSAAFLQCALAYIYKVKKIESGIDLLREGIDDPLASDKDILIMAAANLLPIIKEYPDSYASIKSAVERCGSISWDTYVAYIVNNNVNAWEILKNTIKFEDVYKRYFFKTYINDKLLVSLDSRLTYNPNAISAYIEEHNENELRIQQISFDYADGLSIDDLNKIDCFKANKDLKFLFVDEMIKNQTYLVKNNLNLDDISKETYSGMSNFGLSDKDVKEIVEFCKEKSPKSLNIKLKGNKINIDEKILFDKGGFKVFFKGNELKYQWHHNNMNGMYLRFIFGEDIHLMYKYNTDTKSLIPYLYGKPENFVFYDVDCQNEYSYNNNNKKKK